MSWSPTTRKLAFKKTSSVCTDTVGVGNPVHSRAHLDSKNRPQACSSEIRRKKAGETEQRSLRSSPKDGGETSAEIVLSILQTPTC